MFSGYADGADDPEPALREVTDICGLTLGSEDACEFRDAFPSEGESRRQSAARLVVTTSRGVRLEVVEEGIDGVGALEGGGLSGKHGSLP